MSLKYAILLVAGLLASPVLADSHAASGDAAAGEDAFKKCKACHAITADDGTAIQKGGKVGPNLYGVIGRAAGTQADYKGYSKFMVDAGEKDVVWDEASFTAFVQDPTGFLKEVTGEGGARSKMSFKLNKGIEDIYAYLVSVAP